MAVRYTWHLHNPGQEILVHPPLMTDEDEDSNASLKLATLPTHVRNMSRTCPRNEWYPTEVT